MIRTAVWGAQGRMGALITGLIENEKPRRFELIAAIDRSLPPQKILDAEVVIDFSTPSGIEELLTFLESAKVPLPLLVSGTTGLTARLNEKLQQISKRTPVLHSANFSLGVHILCEATSHIARLAAKAGYQATLVEHHHKHKKDAPSGTALMMCQGVEKGGLPVSQTVSLRSGEVVGEHELRLDGAFDQIRFAHEARDRSVFASGALEASRWLVTKRRASQNLSGFFEIKDFFADLCADL